MAKSPWDAMNDALGFTGAQSIDTLHYMDTGLPPFNKIMSGHYDKGLPNGKMIEIYGESSSGKTLMATNMMISAQQCGGAAIFIDFERSFDVGFAAKLGLNPSQAFSYHKPRSWEEGNNAIIKAARWIRDKKLIPDDAPILAVLDSIAAAPAASTVAKDIDDLNMNDTTALARVTSTTFKSIKQHADDLNVTLVYLNQVRDSMDMYGPKTKTPGGRAVVFFADARFEVKRKIERDPKTKEAVGQVITVKNIKNKFARPEQSFEVPVTFLDNGGVEFDVVAATVEFAVSKGMIEQAGSRVIWGGKSLYKSQVIEAVKKDPDGLRKLTEWLVANDKSAADDAAAGSDKDYSDAECESAA
ncbi:MULTISPECIES: ATPase domain-containing protein [Chromobacterium]|uniref:Protein RecA n=1 Tax=Chromobacterium phragmitis TaxID=2202141 RepID=A0ABV0J0Z6_9NEIS|nr:ATPase domain-containing protein [Chromobacterium sp. ASV23]